MKLRQLLESTKVTYQDFKDVLEFIGQEWAPPHAYGASEPTYANMDDVVDEALTLLRHYHESEAGHKRVVSYLNINANDFRDLMRQDDVKRIQKKIDDLGTDLPGLSPEINGILKQAADLSIRCEHMAEHLNLVNSALQRMYLLMAFVNADETSNKTAEAKVVRAFFRSHGFQL